MSMPSRDDNAPTPPAQVVSRLQMRSPRVLVVDDDDDNREMYVEYLGLGGFVVTGAADATTALAIARAQRPAVIVMDVSLPGMDGLEATRLLKADPLTRDCFVIVLTGRAEQVYRDGAERAGCDLFLSKPCLPPVLLEEIVRGMEQGNPSGAASSRR